MQYFFQWLSRRRLEQVRPQQRERDLQRLLRADGPRRLLRAGVEVVVEEVLRSLHNLPRERQTSKVPPNLEKVWYRQDNAEASPKVFNR